MSYLQSFIQPKWLTASDEIIEELYYPATIYLDALIFLLLVLDVVTRGTFFSILVVVFRTTAEVLGSSSF